MITLARSIASSASKARVHAHLDEFLPALFVDGELCALVARDHDLGPVGQERRALVKGHFIDAKLLLESREDADQRFADGSGADDVNDFFCAMSPPPCHFDRRILAQ